MAQNKLIIYGIIGFVAVLALMMVLNVFPSMGGIINGGQTLTQQNYTMSGGSGLSPTQCFTWNGNIIDTGTLVPSSSCPAFIDRGQVLPSTPLS